MAEALGKKKVGNVHIDKYTHELKDLIGQLHDENLNNKDDDKKKKQDKDVLSGYGDDNKG